MKAAKAQKDGLFKGMYQHIQAKSSQFQPRSRIRMETRKKWYALKTMELEATLIDKA